MTLDVLAVGAHPDDVDLGVGGTLHKLARAGRTIGVLDLTRGEMGTRGTPEDRIREAADAARILGLAVRENAGLPDGGLSNSVEHRLPIVRAIRRHRPKILLAPMAPDRHPDHEAAHDLARDANFFAGLRRLETEEPPFRCPAIFYYYPYYDGSAPPAFIIDISADFEAKLDALRAFRSQLYNPDYPAPGTWIASKEFWVTIEARARFCGARIGADFGEPFFADGAIGLATLPGLSVDS